MHVFILQLSSGQELPQEPSLFALEMNVHGVVCRCAGFARRLHQEDVQPIVKK